jgi:hypothetical protein
VSLFSILFVAKTVTRAISGCCRHENLSGAIGPRRHEALGLQELVAPSIRTSSSLPRALPALTCGISATIPACNCVLVRHKRAAFLVILSISLESLGELAHGLRYPASVKPPQACGIIIIPSLAYMEWAYFDARTFGWSRRPIVELVIPSTIDDTPSPRGQSGPGHPRES